MLPRKQQDLPSSWGTSMVRLPCSKPTPAGLLAPDQYSAVAWPLVIVRQRLLHWAFRRSIAWLSDLLSTLRGADYSSPTQDSLPVAGQALLDGILTRKVPMKGFKGVVYISFPFPKLCLAQTMKLTQFQSRRFRRRRVTRVTPPRLRELRLVSCPGRSCSTRDISIGISLRVF